MPTPAKVPWQPAPVPGFSQASFELGDLLGARGDSIGWGRLLTFFAAQVISDLVWLVFEPLILGHGVASGSRWLMALVVNLVLTGVALGAFRWIRNPFLAALVATVVLVVITLPIRFFMFRMPESMPDRWRFFAYFQANSFLWTLLFLLGLAMAVRWLKPVWLALLLGAGASALAAMMAGTVLSVAIMQSDISWKTVPVDLIRSLAGAAVFAGVFWGGLQLPWAKLEPLPALGRPAAGPQRLSKGFYLGSIAGGLVVYVLLIVVSVAMSASRNPEAGILSLILGALVLLYLVVVLWVLMYKAWAAIQDGYARTTPGKAVGFMFIPFFNIYWIFQALHGFAKDYNTYLDRHGVSAPKLTEGLFLAICILTLVSLVPFLGILAALVNVVLVIIVAGKVCDAVNALPPAGRGPA